MVGPPDSNTPSTPPPPPQTHAQPDRADTVRPETYIVWPVDDEHRSWWSRVRAVKAKYFTRSARDVTVAADADMPGPGAQTNDVTMEAISNLEKHLASLPALHEACASIERRLARVEEVSRHQDHTAINSALHDVCTKMFYLLVRIEESVQLTQQSLAQSIVPETCVNIERQLVQVRIELQRIEEAVAGKQLQELCRNMDAQLERTEHALHHQEGIVTDWFQEISADMSARFADTEEAIQRIERTVTRIIEQAPSQQPFVRSEVHPIWHPWMTRLAVPALMLAALAMGVLIGTTRGHTADAAAPLTTGDPVSTPAQPATKGERGAASTTEVLPDTPPTSRERRVSVSQRAADRTPAPTTSPSSRFVGTLSISSVPSGASVSINGKPAGRTPLRLPRQRAGSLAVQVAHDGFERWSAAVLVPADQLTHVTARLRASAP